MQGENREEKEKCTTLAWWSWPWFKVRGSVSMEQQKFAMDETEVQKNFSYKVYI